MDWEKRCDKCMEYPQIATHEYPSGEIQRLCYVCISKTQEQEAKDALAEED